MSEVVAERQRADGSVGPPEHPRDCDPVTRWHGEWERSVATAEPDPVLAARRRDYGSYVFVALDLVLAFVLAQVIGSVLILALFVVTGHALTSPSLMRDFTAWQSTPQVLLLLLLIPDLGMLLVLWYRLSRLRQGWSLVGLGVELRQGAGRAVLTGVAVAVVALPVAFALTYLLQRLGVPQNEQDTTIIKPIQGAPLALKLLLVSLGVFVAPAIEELFFRGYVFRAIATRKGAPIAYAVSAFTFAAFHGIWQIALPLFVLALLLCFAYRRTGNLLSDYTTHALFNAVNFAIALLAVSQ